jgi:hypothetical protein
MASQAPGAQFLERRLARATAVPPAERSPEVAAFVEAMQLLRKARELLPLTANGKAALPDTMETRLKVCTMTWPLRQLPASSCVCRPALPGCPLLSINLCRLPQALLASAKFFRSEYSCPDHPPQLRETWRHIAAYTWGARVAVAILGGHDTGTFDLTAVVFLYTHMLGGRLKRVQALQGFGAAAGMLAAPDVQQRVQRQLEELAGGREAQQPVLTALQLQYHCYHAMNCSSRDLKQPLEEQLPEFRTAAASSAQALLKLEPNNPKSHAAEADAWGIAAPSSQATKEQVECTLRLFRLAQQQRCDFWAVHAAATALTLAALEPLAVGRDTFGAALAAYEQTAEAGMRRCKRLLPQAWAGQLELEMKLARPFLPRAAEQLLLLQQVGGSRGNSRATTAAVLQSAVVQRAAGIQQIGPVMVDWLDHYSDCGGCGKRAMGLRRCARCRQAQYCRCVMPLLGWVQLLCTC